MPARPSPAPRPSAAPRAIGAPGAARPAAQARLLDESAFLADERHLAAWREVVLAVNARKRMLGAFLEESRFLGVSESALALVTDDLHRAVIEEVENRKLVGEELARVFGRPLELVCGAVQPMDTAPVTESEAPDVQSMIARAIEWFDGEAIAPPAPRPERREQPWRERNPR
jgi:hypothetical protein